METYRVHWRYNTKTTGLYEGCEEINACNEEEALEITIARCRAKGFSNWSGKLTIIDTEIINMEPLNQQQKYDAHVQAWAKINYKPSKKELDDLAFIYKVGKYAPKKGKGNA